MMKRALIIAVGFVLTLSAVQSQTKGRIEGRVLDAAGQPLEKAAVTVVSQKTSSIHYELTTDARGGFMQIGLPPGNYVVSAKKDGFAPSAKEIHVSIAETTAVDLSLKTVEAALEKTLSRADALFLRGNKFYAEQKYAEAADSFEEAVKLDAGSWRYFLNLGLARKKMNRAEEGLAAFLKAVELNPESASANKEAGESLAKAGRFSDAKPYYEKAAGLSPGDPDAQYNLGVCLINLGESEAALPRFQRAVELNPDYADAYYQLGTILIGQNRAADAVAALEKFLSVAPGHEKAALAKQLLEYLKK